MPFWTWFWLVVPAVVLIGIGVLYYLLAAKEDE
jgi:hypothetical protein